jgi:FkbM family methyltransferase
MISSTIKDLAFSILDKSKQRGFHLFKDLKFYSSEFNLSTENIFDVGANIGQTSMELRKYFPGSSIHAFEPVNSTFEILKKNLCEDRKIILNNVALGAEEKEVTIFIRGESLINSLLNEVTINDVNETIVAQNQLTQNVQVINGDEYCNCNNTNSVFF